MWRSSELPKTSGQARSRQRPIAAMEITQNNDAKWEPTYSEDAPVWSPTNGQHDFIGWLFFIESIICTISYAVGRSSRKHRERPDAGNDPGRQYRVGIIYGGNKINSPTATIES